MNSQRPRAVVFDFDGTLADSYAAIAASVNHVRAHYGKPPLSVADVNRHVGRGPDYLLAHTVGSGDPQGDVVRYRAHHPSVMRSLTRLLPGALEVLRTLRATGRRAGVCSNKPRVFTAELLRAMEVDGYIDTIVGPEDAPRPKPAPEMLTLALQKLNVAADEALYVGDMVVDIETARGAGVCVWVVATGSDDRATLLEARPDRMLADLFELSNYLAPGEYTGG